MKCAAKQVKAGGIETIVAGIKRHAGHVEAKENERNCHSSPVKTANFEVFKKRFGTVIKKYAEAHKNKDVHHLEHGVKRNFHLSIYALIINILQICRNLFAQRYFCRYCHQHNGKYFL